LAPCPLPTPMPERSTHRKLATTAGDRKNCKVPLSSHAKVRWKFMAKVWVEVFEPLASTSYQSNNHQRANAARERPSVDAPATASCTSLLTHSSLDTVRRARELAHCSELPPTTCSDVARLPDWKTKFRTELSRTLNPSFHKMVMILLCGHVYII